MLALSIRQPWAYLIVNGHKAIENRTWDTKHRGEILIHAGLKFDWTGMLWVARNMPHIPMPTVCSIPRGGFVGKAVITDVITESNDPWFFGPFGFVLEKAEKLPFRPFRGQLSFFEVNL